MGVLGQPPPSAQQVVESATTVAFQLSVSDRVVAQFGPQDGNPSHRAPGRDSGVDKSVLVSAASAFAQRFRAAVQRLQALEQDAPTGTSTGVDSRRALATPGTGWQQTIAVRVPADASVDDVCGFVLTKVLATRAAASLPNQIAPGSVYGTLCEGSAKLALWLMQADVHLYPIGADGAVRSVPLRRYKSATNKTKASELCWMAKDASWEPSQRHNVVANMPLKTRLCKLGIVAPIALHIDIPDFNWRVRTHGAEEVWGRAAVLGQEQAALHGLVLPFMRLEEAYFAMRDYLVLEQARERHHRLHLAFEASACEAGLQEIVRCELEDRRMIAAARDEFTPLVQASAEHLDLFAIAYALRHAIARQEDEAFTQLMERHAYFLRQRAILLRATQHHAQLITDTTALHAAAERSKVLLFDSSVTALLTRAR